MNKVVYVYLNARDPLVEWNIACGRISSPYNIRKFYSKSFISFFLKQRLCVNNENYAFELALEQRRQEKFSTKISRLEGLFCFESEDEAKSAKLCGLNHRSEDLTQCILLKNMLQKHDMNWITWHSSYGNNYPSNWMDLYWEGKVCDYCNKPNPIWECLTYSDLIVSDNEKILQCLEQIKKEDDRNWALCALGIWATYFGIPLSTIGYYLLNNNSCIQIIPVINFPDHVAGIVAKKLKYEDVGSFNAIFSVLGKYDTLKVPNFSDKGYCLTCKCPWNKCINFRTSTSNITNTP